MPYVAAHPHSRAGQTVGNGHCVAYVREACGAPHTTQWRRGDLVRHGKVAVGTAIATFDRDGTYGNHTDGSSHAAVLLEETPEGLRVLDQWIGQPVHQRIIRYAGEGKAVNNGNEYHVIEPARHEVA